MLQGAPNFTQMRMDPEQTGSQKEIHVLSRSWQIYVDPRGVLKWLPKIGGFILGSIRKQARKVTLKETTNINPLTSYFRRIRHGDLGSDPFWKTSSSGKGGIAKRPPTLMHPLCPDPVPIISRTWEPTQ